MTKDIEQRSDDWYEIRLGKFTASNAFKLLDRTAKGLPTAVRQDYIWKTVIERLTGQKTEIYTTPAMQWGIDNEPVAKAFYEELYDEVVEEHGFEIHKTLPFVGASPDGVIKGKPKLLEIKCPQPKGFLNIKVTDSPDPAYVLQTQWQMMCLDAEEADLFYFNPMFEPEICFHKFNIKRNDELIHQLEEAAIQANEEVESLISKIYGR